ncbi:MAG TPA: PAS domain S-box protein [Solirubrobacteraceae bacterium]|nr:PAS domain S-box protein [Solirubrobacteraceae bacterium]
MSSHTREGEALPVSHAEFGGGPTTAALPDLEGVYRSLIDTAPDGMVIVDEQARIVLVNAEAERMFGYAREELLGQSIEVLLPLPVRERHETLRSAFAADPHTRFRGAGLELAGRRADGSTFPADVSLSPVRTDGGLLISAGVRDMSARRRTDAALRLAEERFRLAFDAAPIGMALVTLAGAWMQVNHTLCEITGLAETDLLRTRLQDFVDPTDLEHNLARARRLAGGEERSFQTEVPLHVSSGRVVWARVSVSLVRDSTGAPLHYVCQVEDITAAREAAAERDGVRRQLEEAQRIAGIGSWTWHRRTHAAFWSPQLFCLFGRDPALGAPEGLELAAYVVAEDRPLVAGLETSQGPFAFDLHIEAADGTPRTVHVIGRPDPDDPDSLSGTVQDVTEIRENERRLAEAQTMAGVGWWEWDFKAGVARCSDELCRIYGAAPGSTATREDFAAFIHPDDLEAALLRLDRNAGRANSGLDESDFRILRADGSIRHVHSRRFSQTNADGRLTRLMGIVQDITARAQRDAEERVLRRLAELVARPAEPEAVFRQVAADVCTLFQCHSGVVARYDEAAGVALLVQATLADGRSLTGATLELSGDNAPAIVYRTGAAGRTHGTPSSGLDARIVEVAAEISDAVAAPIFVAGRLWGCLAAAFAGRDAPADTEDRLGHFAHLVAMAVANAEAWQRLARQATTDAVTGLANHRAFQSRLSAETSRARRHGRPLSLVLLDLDHFKQVNDSHGHQVGDRVLAEVARRIAAEAREGDLVARVGGEEFAWLMPETDRRAAMRAAERVRASVSSTPVSGVGRITVSAGICSNAEARGAEEIVRRADRALYWAKEGGRNVSFIYSEEANAILSQPTGASPAETLGSVRALAQAIDSKDPSTRQHSERVAALAERIARELGWTSKRARALYHCGVLHDVGKIGIPDEIILKPGRLTAEEYELVKQHAQLGARIASEVLEHEQVTWVRGHHERWDGSGYPDGLAGAEIPDGAQILAVADAYDVMTQSRAYQVRRSPGEALAECLSLAGAQFAPEVVEAFAGLVLADASPFVESGAD